MVTPTKQGVTDSAAGFLVAAAIVGTVKTAPKAWSWIKSKFSSEEKKEEAKAA